MPRRSVAVDVSYVVPVSTASSSLAAPVTSRSAESREPEKQPGTAVDNTPTCGNGTDWRRLNLDAGDGSGSGNCGAVASSHLSGQSAPTRLCGQGDQKCVASECCRACDWTRGALVSAFGPGVGR
eukprot:1348252-Amphidinium_carterae.1